MTPREIVKLLGVLEAMEHAATRREIHKLRAEFRVAVRLLLCALDARRARSS
jgi:hypothetical protein